MEETLYKVGDKVEIVNYGHKIYRYDNIQQDIDLSPELIGKTGIIVEAHKTQNIDNYAIFIVGKSAWYHNDQLKLLYRPNYENYQQEQENIKILEAKILEFSYTLKKHHEANKDDVTGLIRANFDEYFGITSQRQGKV